MVRITWQTTSQVTGPRTAVQVTLLQLFFQIGKNATVTSQNEVKSCCEKLIWDPLPLPNMSLTSQAFLPADDSINKSSAQTSRQAHNCLHAENQFS